MIVTLLFVAFIVMMLAGVPIGAALGLAGATAIALANADAQWFGLLAVPQNFYAGLGKYPLLAIPMFVLVGSIFDRSGVALRLVNFAVAIVGRGPGMLPLVAIVVAMFLDGISIFLIFVPLLLPIAQHYHWDLVWFGVILTLKVALGQFTPPLAVNLMVSCRIAHVRMEETVRWVVWMLAAMFIVLVAVIAFPELALWLPRKLGY